MDRPTYNNRTFKATCMSEHMKELMLHYGKYHSDKMTITELVSAGFTFVKEGEGHVVCISCGIKLSADFQEHFDALAVHRLYSSGRCSFLSSVQHTPDVDAEATTSAVRDVRDHNTDVLTITSTGSSVMEEYTGLDSTNKRYHRLRESNAHNVIASLASEVRLHTGGVTYEAFRRKTFTKLSEHGKAFSIQGIDNLSAKGFYLASENANGVAIHCAFCDFSQAVSVSRFEGESAVTLHSHQSPSCPMLTGIVRQQPNIPDILYVGCWCADTDSQTLFAGNRFSLGIISDMAKYPEMAVLRRREETFLTFPDRAYQGELATLYEAGYFFQGGSDGSVTCFWCGCHSANWSLGESAWQRHARTSSSCQFVVQQKGMEFIRSVVDSHGIYNDREKEDKINTITNRMMRPRMDSQVVQRALDLGLNREAVRAVVGKRIKKGMEDFRWVADIVCEISNLTIPGHVLSGDTEQIWLPKLLQAPIANENEEQVASQIDSTHHEEEEISTASELEDSISATDINTNSEDGAQDNRTQAKQMISQLTCKICLSDIIGIIFLPCGHLVCCTSCAAAMTTCPLCRKEVKGTVKANFINSSLGLR